MLENACLLRCPHSSSLQRTSRYASLLRISEALHPSVFEHPHKNSEAPRLEGLLAGHLLVTQNNSSSVVDARLRLNPLPVRVLHFFDFTDRVSQINDPRVGIPACQDEMQR